jgi:replication-associated recombination protein RarA
VDTKSWPIVRREVEFSAIRSALAGQQGISGIVLFGDAGVGKTTVGPIGDPLAADASALGGRN